MGDDPTAACGNCCLKLARRSSPGFCALVLQMVKSRISLWSGLCCFHNPILSCLGSLAPRQPGHNTRGWHAAHFRACIPCC